MSKLEKLMRKYNEFVESDNTISGDFPAFAFDGVKLLVRKP